ncbi:hypothetical protein ACOSQ3_025541 [Xanthoceras sorbifolium]
MLCSITCHAIMTILPWCFHLLLIYSFSSSSATTLNAIETDRLALLAVRSQLVDPSGVTSSWNNSLSLCLWTGVTCSRRHQRVTSLDLSNQKIGGRLSPFIGNLSFLRSINLDTNSFYGEIPHEVGRLFRLETLILANNSFSGTIPTNLSRCSNLITFAAYSNNLVGEIPTEIGSLLKLEKLAVGQNHLSGQLPAFIGNLTNLRRLDFVRNNLHGTIPETIAQLRSLTTLNLAVNNFSELSKATDEFSSSNIIGEGSYGLVYKGMLGEDSMLVAIKMINLKRKGASKSFMAECGALRNARHRNLIKVITVCSSIDFKGDDFKALVYEYMQNGSLEKWLHYNKDQLDVGNLSFIQRLNIAIDVASAIEYLHHYCQPPIIHGDLKPSNVLLDHDMVAHVGDFGLAKFLLDHPASTTDGTQSSSIGIKGTVGYIAPEYGMGSEMSMLGDVYSFGILLIELITGRRPTNSMLNDGRTLHDFAKMALPKRVMEIVEPSLLLEVKTSSNEHVENFATRHGERRGTIEECLVVVMRIGVLCTMESPAERMEMIDVVAKLRSVRENFLGGDVAD